MPDHAELKDKLPPESSPVDTRIRLDMLTGLRFYAALAVVLLHVTRDFAPVPLLREFFAPGAVGVSFFFILSGFVLTWSSRPDVAKRDFYRNRFARIYPLHLVTWIAAAIVGITSGENINLLPAIAALVLVQAWIPLESVFFAMNGPSWSLSAEAFFYAVFPWLGPFVARLTIRQIGILMILLYSSVAIITVSGVFLLRGGPTVAVFYVNPLYRIWEFIFGITLAVLVKKGWRIRVGLRLAVTLTLGAYGAVALASYLLNSGIGWVENLDMSGVPSYLASLAMVPLFSLLICSTVAAELRGETSHLNSRTLVRLGKWSFALYLIHLLLIEALEPLVPSTLEWPSALLLATGTVVIAVLLSGVCYRLIEHPLEARLRTPRSPSRRLKR